LVYFWKLSPLRAAAPSLGHKRFSEYHQASAVGRVDYRSQERIGVRAPYLIKKEQAEDNRLRNPGVKIEQTNLYRCPMCANAEFHSRLFGWKNQQFRQDLAEFALIG
jgi:uncharacterized protein (DUF2252 family)